MREDLYNPDRACKYTGHSKSNYAKRRHLGLPPRYVKVGKFVYYRKRDLDEFIDSCVVEPVADLARGGAR